MDIDRRRLGEFLLLQADGYACTTEKILDVLLTVSFQKETIEQVCSDLKIKVGAETIRGYFNEQLKVKNLDNLQEAVNLALQRSFSSELKGQKLEMAIDFHDQSYYDKVDQSEGKWVGAGFSPDTNEKGNPTNQRWQITNAEGKVTIDFLIPTTEGDIGKVKRLKNLEKDFAALPADGLILAFADYNYYCFTKITFIRLSHFLTD